MLLLEHSPNAGKYALNSALLPVLCSFFTRWKLLWRMEQFHYNRQALTFSRVIAALFLEHEFNAVAFFLSKRLGFPVST